METENDNQIGAKSRIDIKTTLKGVIRRWFILAICIVAAVVAIKKMPQRKSQEKYTSESIVEFHPAPEDVLNTNPQTLLATIKDTVKLRENVVSVQRELGLTASTDTIGKALDAHIQKNTMLLVFGATWDSPQTAADMANTLRTVFMRHFSDTARQDLNNRLKETRQRQSTVAAKLSGADGELQQFTSLNRIVDIDRQSSALLDEYNSYGLQLEIAVAEQKTVEEQARKLDAVIADLKSKVEQESRSMTQFESLHDLNVRIQNLKDMMRESRETRINSTDLNFLKDEMDRMKALHDQGAISDIELQRSVTAYEKAKIVAVDTDQIKSWKAELEKLQKVFVPVNGQTSPSSPLLHDMLAKMFYIQLDRIGVEEKVSSLNRARARVRAQLDNIPKLRQRFDALKREIAGSEKERKDLESNVAAVTRLGELRDTEFQLIDPARAEPLGAKRMNLIPIMIFAGAFVLGLATMIVMEMLDRSVRSLAEVDMRLDMPVLGWIPKRRVGALLIGPDEKTASERLTLASRKLRSLVPQFGARIAVVGPAGDGATTLAANLGAALARQGERVLIIDLQGPTGRKQRTAADLIHPTPAVEDGLAEYLTGTSHAKETMYHETRVPDLYCIPRYERAISPDLLASHKMTQLLQDASAEFGVVLLDLSPAQSGIESEITAPLSDGVVYAVKSRGMRAATIKRAVEKLTKMGAQTVGVMLNNVPKLYQGGE